MAQDIIDLGAAPNDGTGDPLRDGGQKLNTMFAEVYALIAGASDSISGVATGKLSLTGGTMTGILNLGGFRLENLAAPNSDDDATNRGYVTNAISTAVTAETNARNTALGNYVPKTRTVTGGGLASASNGGALDANITITVSAASDAEAVAGIITTKALTPASGAAAIAAAVATLQTAITAINNLVASLTPASGSAFSVLDPLSQELLGIDNTTYQFSTALTLNVDALLTGLRTDITTLQAVSLYTAPIEAGLTFGVLANGQDALIVDDAGDLIDSNGYNHTKFQRDGTLSAGLIAGISAAILKGLVYPTDDIRWNGDSHTENWASRNAMIQAALTAAGDTKIRTIAGFGLGGISGAGIAARMGAILPKILFPVGSSGLPEVPAAGTVAITLDVPFLNHPGSLNVEAQSMAGKVMIHGGIAGTVTRTAGTTNYTFTRTTAGDAIPVPGTGQALFRPSSDTLRKATTPIWMCTNDLIASSPAATISQLMIDTIENVSIAGGHRGPVMMPTWNFGTGDVAKRAIYDSVLGILTPLYGDRVVDTIWIMRNNGDGSGNDNADIAAGLIPRSLMEGDRTHFPDGGVAYGLVASAWADIYFKNGW